ncbi:N-acetyl-gamma-glutamyl-phosphate reductase [Ignisphaera sp. 4213-co]|uniref:Putative [LysW]-L-2-aminoadipate/[LysW]-L-glutamate phosphate reductase n=1 Tax=Ignisphaera cupida TaxID=3050454 RepID=A0ABD4ZA13_9CREN|nr:N-acetyl-gamma-glutamyl-phosphate reductase [Ignisphaera sp. 4213-co]MDK6029140.1 N-acetyl-gamma-glutamyl-phosphate reductase [Ignisphaera sp. 4213-co]
MSSNSKKVCILGASGYTGGELLRLLANHPGVEVVMATSREYVGKPVHYVHFNLRGIYRNLKFTDINLDAVSKNCDAVFLSLPHGVSLNYVPKILEMGILTIDLSADFRLKNPELYKMWYGFEHPYPDLLNKAVYGLPEIHRDELKNAKLIASPGCNATAGILSLLPLVKNNLIFLDKIVVDVKVGSSEAGSKPSIADHHPEREGCIRPYDADGHRHAAEVEQELSLVVGKSVSISMVPHAVGSVRGALASSHAWLTQNIDDVEMLKYYVATYKNEPFIRIVYKVPPGYPDPKYVVGSNYADIGFAIEKRIGRVTSFAAIDNLVKGAAGQAIQAFNIAMGFEETAGLLIVPPKPV